MPTYVEASIKSIVIDPNIDSTAFPVVTFVAGGARSVLEVPENQRLDYDTEEIAWSYETGYTSSEGGELFTFSSLQFRAALYVDPDLDASVGLNKTLTIEICPIDEVFMSTVRTINLTPRPIKWYSVIADLVTEQARIKLSGYNQIFFSALSLFVSKRAEGRQRD